MTQNGTSEEQPTQPEQLTPPATLGSIQRGIGSLAVTIMDMRVETKAELKKLSDRVAALENKPAGGGGTGNSMPPTPETVNAFVGPITQHLRGSRRGLQVAVFVGTVVATIVTQIIAHQAPSITTPAAASSSAATHEASK